jgi:hypothetical protein
MRALVWIIEDTWEVTVAEAAQFLPGDADITLLHVASTEPETVARAARRGLLGRHPPPPPDPEPLRGISEHAANKLLAEAQTRLGRPATSRPAAGVSNARSWPPPTAWTSLSSPATATASGSDRAALAPRRAVSSTTPPAEFCSSGPTSHPS